MSSRRIDPQKSVKLFRVLSRGFVAPDYSPAFRGLSFRLQDHVMEMACQRQQLPALREHLRGLSPDDRRILLRADPAFHNWALGEELIEESRKSLGSDLDRARELADCAAIVTGALESGNGFSDALINDLRARAWGVRGEVLRRLADLRGAGEAFATAEGFLAEGTEDPLEEAGILELKAALYRDQSRTREACCMLDGAAA